MAAVAEATMAVVAFAVVARPFTAVVFAVAAPCSVAADFVPAMPSAVGAIATARIVMADLDLRTGIISGRAFTATRRITIPIRTAAGSSGPITDRAASAITATTAGTIAGTIADFRFASSGEARRQV